jgi:putative acetyltransferase
MTDILIRPERADDYQAIHDVTARAFAPKPYADGDEQLLIGRLRDAGALALSLVADQAGRVVGQVTLTPAFAADGSAGWYALGPIAVEPAWQGVGIGGELIGAGIGWMRSKHAAGCALVGNPAYYGRFGFRPFPALAPAGQPAAFYQILPLGIPEPGVVVAFHPLFGGHAA